MAESGDRGADPKSAWVLSVLGVDVQRPASGTASSSGMSAWKAARASAIADLTRLGAAIAKAKLVDAAPAIILLRAIRANLTEEPSTPRQVAELRRYLREDQIIKDAEGPNGYGVKIVLRAPLLAALDKIDSATVS